MKHLLLIFMILGAFIEPAHAQNIFEYDEVDFFNSLETQGKVSQAPSKEKPEAVESEWAEPIISPSGNVTIYVPPKEVKDFLDNPVPGNARAYLEWNTKRIQKFIIAQQLLEKEVKGMGLNKDKNDLTPITSLPDGASLVNNTGDGRNHLFYFMLKGCPACLEESKVMEDIYLNHPEIKIEAFADGFSDKELKDFVFPVRQDNGVSQYFKINAYPTILVFNEKKERYLISGYVDKDKILELFQ